MLLSRLGTKLIFSIFLWRSKVTGILVLGRSMHPSNVIDPSAIVIGLHGGVKHFVLGLLKLLTLSPVTWAVTKKQLLAYRTLITA